jgi:Ca2+-transporting ATPase
MATNPTWHTIDAAAAARQLSVDASVGLDTTDVERRREVHGANEFITHQESGWARLISNQFRDFMILVLIAAAAVSGVIGEVKDAIAILVIVVLNAVVGIVQEYRAERALEALRSLIVPSARVRRAGRITTVPSRDLVPGDVVLLETGAAVPADIRLTHAEEMATDESALTGESEIIAKQLAALDDDDMPIGDRSNLAFHGSLIARGHGEGVVYATGADTELGCIAEMLHAIPVSRTPLQQRLARFGRRLALIVLSICLFIFILGLLRGEPVVLMFLTAVSLAVAAIPEALPAVVTISLALGARKMSKAHALMRRLPAVETLGSVTYICADKTGTLTENRMHVDFIDIDGERYERINEHVASRRPMLGPALALNNEVVVDRDDGIFGEPTETALFEFAKHSGYDKQVLSSDYPRLREVPFHSETKRMTTVHSSREGIVAFLKGAPEVVVPLCSGATGRTLDQAEQLADNGYRVLAIAGKQLRSSAGDIESGFMLYALVALSDPPREGVLEAVNLCRTAGISPVMVTGDHPRTALAIARRVGIASEDDVAITGAELTHMAHEKLADRIANTRVYARVDPAQKIHIVEALQARGEFVAMTGDGVNDAPALRQSNIGVAMGKKGTDAAREAADMVLLDDNFSTIVSAVREGRRIFDNILKFIRYTMTSNAGEIFTMLMAPLFGLPIPLLPIHILWINLVTDGLPGLALAAEPAETGAMHRPPRPPEQRIFTRSMLERIFWIGLLIAGLSLASQAWAYHGGSGNWQTMVFTVLTLSQLVNVLMIRSERESIFGWWFFGNRPLLAAVALTLILQLVVIYWPPVQDIFNTAALTAGELAICVLLSSAVLAVAEIEKLIRRNARPNHESLR